MQAENIVEFTNELSSDDKFNFQVKLVGRFIRTFPGNFRHKITIHELLKMINV